MRCVGVRGLGRYVKGEEAPLGMADRTVGEITETPSPLGFLAPAESHGSGTRLSPADAARLSPAT